MFWDPPVTFELIVREQNQPGFWNISIRQTSGASFIKIGRPTFSTSGTFSQTMTLKPLGTGQKLEGGGEGWCIFILAYQFWGDPPHSRCRKNVDPSK